MNSGLISGRDALYRFLPMNDRVGDLGKDKLVGMFYFINLGSENEINKHHNVEEIMTRTPEAIGDLQHPVWEEGPYHWGEPLFGFYRHDDEWVIRKHVMMLTLAGVDFIVFDTTNNSMHKETALAVMKVLETFQHEGVQVPKVVFYTNTRSGERVQQIYVAVYKEGKYKDIWFYWEDKPLIIGRPEECSKETVDFFTFRNSQWPTEPPKLTGGFPWIDFNRPQLMYKNKAGENEIMSVSIAQHPQIKFGDSAFYGEVANRGRSYHGFANDALKGAIDYGYNIAEQWEYAISCDPKIIFVTGWNEWTAGMLKRPKCKERPITFIDSCSPEFSRDIEPRKGGHFDNYYMQLIDYIRRFKGVEKTPVASGEKTIDIFGDFTQWNAIEPTYYGFPFANHARNHAGFGDEVFIDDSGRNNFEVMKVSHDQAYVYFYAKCYEPITAYDFTPWMRLFISVIQPLDSCRPHWEGYHFLANSEFLNGDSTFICQCKGGWRWETLGYSLLQTKENELQLSIPKKMLGLENEAHFELQFKWVDHMSESENIEDFYLNGVTAPYGRLNYVFKV